MAEIVLDGFRFSQWAGGRQLLIVESERLEQSVAYCNKKQIRWLHISPYHGYELDDLEFLPKCRTVTGIHLQGGVSNFDGLYRLQNLESLSVVFPHHLMLSEFPKLTDLATDWNPSIDESLFKVKSLSRLWIRKYKPVNEDLERIKALKGLEELTIIESSIRSLEGIQALSQLKTLGLAYCRKLVTIESLLELKGNLRELEIDHCKGIKDLSVIGALTQLRKAILADNGEIPSLEFVRGMPRLEFLSFVGTKVRDGDMTPCFSLKYAGFLKRRGYSHTPEEVADMIAKQSHSL